MSEPDDPSPESIARLAEEMWSLAQCATGAGLEEDYGVRYMTGQTSRTIDYAVDIRVLLGKADRSGYLVAVLVEGHRIEDVPVWKERSLHADLDYFGSLLRKGGYKTE